MFHNNIMKISEKLNKLNWLKMYLQFHGWKSGGWEGDGGDYHETALTRIHSHATSYTSRGSDNAKISVNKVGAPPFLVCFKKNERINQNSGNAISCKYNLTIHIGQRKY